METTITLRLFPSYVRRGRVWSLSWLMLVSVLILASQTSRAGSATWKLNPGSNDWHTSTNWTPVTVPNGPGDTATFGLSNAATVAISATATQLDRMVFNAGASAYTLIFNPAAPGSCCAVLTSFTGTGITNSSGKTQNLVVAAGSEGFGGEIDFLNSATAGSLTSFTTYASDAANNPIGGFIYFGNSSTAGSAAFLNHGVAVSLGRQGVINFVQASSADHGTFTNNGSSVSGAFGGYISFNGTSTAAQGFFTNNGGTASNAFGGSTYFAGTSTGGNGTFINNGGTANGASGGETEFSGTATAAQATLIANGGVGGGRGGTIRFSGNSSGGTARVKTWSNSRLNLAIHNGPLSLGSIEGDGNVFLGANSLIVGSNSLSTTFSGVFDDGGAGGSLGKGGTGILSLANSNTYSGGTVISAGGLEASHDHALGAGDVTLLTAGATLTLQNGATNDYIADTATLAIISGATINLNFSGTDRVGILIVDGMVQPPALHGSGSISSRTTTNHTVAQKTSGFAGPGQILAALPVAVSRRMHGGTPYDIYLPMTGNVGIECRNPGANNSYQIVVAFLNSVTFTGASVTSGNGMVTTTSGSGTKFATINLVGVSNAQTIDVTLFGTNDGNTTTDLVIPMSVLVGDTDGNGAVNSSDVSQVKLQSGHAVDASNFRNDVTANGGISATDVSLVKAKSGTGLR